MHVQISEEDLLGRGLLTAREKRQAATNAVLRLSDRLDRRRAPPAADDRSRVLLATTASKSSKHGESDEPIPHFWRRLPARSLRGTAAAGLPAQSANHLGDDTGAGFAVAVAAR